MATTSKLVKIRTVVLITTLLFIFILFSSQRHSRLLSANDANVEQMDYQQIGVSACPPDPQREDERPPIIIRSTDVSTVETPPVNAAIIFLIEFLDRPLAQNHKEMMRFNQSLWSLWNNFNQEYRYPVHIFHEWPFNSTYRDQYRAMWPKDMNVTFHEVEFKLPATFPQIDVNDPAQIDSLNMNPTARRAFPGYNHMIHFFMVDIFQHPAIKDLEYFWRLDHDSRLDSKVGLDVFRYMRSRGMDYGYRVVGQEARHVARGMLDFFNDYLHNSSNNAVDGISAYDEAHRNCLAIPQDYNARKETAPLLYYNNFEIVNVQTWQSPEIQALTKAIDDTNMIYWNRWGDAPLR
jgi:mannosyltransferase